MMCVRVLFPFATGASFCTHVLTRSRPNRHPRGCFYGVSLVYSTGSRRINVSSSLVSCSHGSFYLHATLSTADLTLSTTSTEVVYSMASSSKQRQPFVQLDNFLFSDDDASEQPELIQGAASDHEVVPDSSDEASTGPALDLGPETEGDDLLSAVPAFGVATMQDENSFAHVEASSGTRQGVFTRPQMDVIGLLIGSLITSRLCSVCYSLQDITYRL